MSKSQHNALKNQRWKASVRLSLTVVFSAVPHEGAPMPFNNCIYSIIILHSTIPTGTMLMPTLTFWLLNALLLVVDTTGKPSFITRYRIQVDKNNPVGCHRIQTAPGFVAPVCNFQRQCVENWLSLELLQFFWPWLLSQTWANLTWIARRIISSSWSLKSHSEAVSRMCFEHLKAATQTGLVSDLQVGHVDMSTHESDQSPSCARAGVDADHDKLQHCW